MGVRFVGRFAAVRDGVAQFSGSLRNVCALADLKLGRLLDTIDEWAPRAGSTPRSILPTALSRQSTGHPRWSSTCAPVRSARSCGPPGTGPTTSWLDVPVIDRRPAAPRGRRRRRAGLYVVGLPFLRRRRSSFIDGACADTADLADHLASYLDRFALAD